MPGPAPHRVAAIDCGTNTLRLLISDIDGDTKRDLVRTSRYPRLGVGVDDTGRLADRSIDLALSACREYAAEIERHVADTVLFCATSATRDASNGEEFSAEVEAVLGIRPQIVTGDVEAALSFDGAVRELPTGRAAVVDLGGGSTEIAVGAGEQVWTRSHNIGAVRLTERFLHSDPPTAAEVQQCREFVATVLPASPAADGPPLPVEQVVGVSGTIVTVAAMALGMTNLTEDLHGRTVPYGDVRQACTDLVAMSVAERRSIGCMKPERADVIGAGAIILDALLDHLPVATNQLSISLRDILDGIAWAAARGHMPST